MQNRKKVAIGTILAPEEIEKISQKLTLNNFEIQKIKDAEEIPDFENYFIGAIMMNEIEIAKKLADALEPSDLACLLRKKMWITSTANPRSGYSGTLLHAALFWNVNYPTLEYLTTLACDYVSQDRDGLPPLHTALRHFDIGSNPDFKIEASETDEVENSKQAYENFHKLVLLINKSPSSFNQDGKNTLHELVARKDWEIFLPYLLAKDIYVLARTIGTNKTVLDLCNKEQKPRLKAWLGLYQAIKDMEVYGHDLQFENTGWEKRMQDGATLRQNALAHPQSFSSGAVLSPTDSNYHRTFEGQLDLASSAYSEGVRMKIAYEKGLIVRNLAASLKENLVTLDLSNPQSEKNQQFFNLLHSQDRLLADHRGFKTLVANIGLCLAGLGIFYVVAGLIHLYQTKGEHFLFFHNTASQNKCAKVEYWAEKITSPAIKIH